MQNDAQARIEILTSRSGMPTVRVLSSNGKRAYLHSSVDPVQEAKNVAAGVAVQRGTILVVYGFALGYLIEALLETIDEKIPLFIIEPDRELFQTAAQVRDLQHIVGSPRVKIMLGNNIDEIKDRFCMSYDTARYDKAVFSGLSGHKTVYADFYAKIVEGINDVFTAQVIDDNTMKQIGPAMMSNALRNLPAYYTHPGVRALFDRFKGMPAVIVAAGPSLNKNIHLLQEVKGKAVIMAVGTAVKALQKWGIEPDFIVSSDPGLPNYEHFKGVEAENTALITEMQSHHLIVKEYKGPIFFSGKMPILTWFGNAIENKGYVESGGSAANNAMAAAYKMGADPLILVGQDLAYAPDGHSHAAGTNYEYHIYNGGQSDNHFYVKANNGGQVLTDHAFYQFLSFFEAWIRRHPDREYINATEGGAFIEGTQLMTLQEAIRKYCTGYIDIPVLIRQAADSFICPPFAPLADALDARLQEAASIICEAQNALNDLNQLEEACEKRQLEHIGRLLQNVQQVYEKFGQDRYICNIVEWFAHDEIQQVFSRTYQAEFAEQDSIHAAIADYKLYYDKVLDGAQRLQWLIGDCLKQMRETSGVVNNADIQDKQCK